MAYWACFSGLQNMFLHSKENVLHWTCFVVHITSQGHSFDRNSQLHKEWIRPRLLSGSISLAADCGQDQRDDVGLQQEGESFAAPETDNRLHQTNSRVVYKRGLTHYFLRKLRSFNMCSRKCSFLSVCYDQCSVLLCGLLEAQHHS